MQDKQDVVEKYSGCDSFLDMGDILYSSPSQGLTIRAGQIFQGKTVKGGTNLIVAMRTMPGFMVYAHGDKVKKVDMETFINSVLHGDLEPKLINEVDPGRLSMSVIGLDAIANRRCGEVQIDAMTEKRIERMRSGPQIQVVKG